MKAATTKKITATKKATTMKKVTATKKVVTLTKKKPVKASAACKKPTSPVKIITKKSSKKIQNALEGDKHSKSIVKQKGEVDFNDTDNTSREAEKVIKSAKNNKESLTNNPDSPSSDHVRVTCATGKLRGKTASRGKTDSNAKFRPKPVIHNSRSSAYICPSTNREKPKCVTQRMRSTGTIIDLTLETPEVLLADRRDQILQPVQTLSNPHIRKPWSNQSNVCLRDAVIDLTLESAGSISAGRRTEKRAEDVRDVTNLRGISIHKTAKGTVSSMLNQRVDTISSEVAIPLEVSMSTSPAEIDEQFPPSNLQSLPGKDVKTVVLGSTINDKLYFPSGSCATTSAPLPFASDQIVRQTQAVPVNSIDANMHIQTGPVKRKIPKDEVTDDAFNKLARLDNQAGLVTADGGSNVALSAVIQSLRMQEKFDHSSSRSSTIPLSATATNQGSSLTQIERAIRKCSSAFRAFSETVQALPLEKAEVLGRVIFSARWDAEKMGEWAELMERECRLAVKK